MSNSKLIVIEGPQGVGKTTLTDFLRNSLSYTNLYRLSGSSDSTQSGLDKSRQMYKALLDYIQSLENKSINLLFDRLFFTEENYCRCGFKEYNFTETYNELLEKFSKLDFDIYYITLYLKNTTLFEDRIKRDGKAVYSYAKFKAESSIKQQNVFLEIAEEIKVKYPNIKILNLANDTDLDASKNALRNFIGF